MLDVEVIGSSELPEEALCRLVAIALASAGIEEGHVAVEFVEAERIAELNTAHRGVEGPTDVLSFPVDEDLEESARFYEEDNGELHIRSDFLSADGEVRRNVRVAFILHSNVRRPVRRWESCPPPTPPPLRQQYGWAPRAPVSRTSRRPERRRPKMPRSRRAPAP